MCAEEGGYLVTIIAESENAVMQLATAEDDLPVWTGGRDVDVRLYQFCPYRMNSVNNRSNLKKKKRKMNTEKSNFK